MCHDSLFELGCEMVFPSEWPNYPSRFARCGIVSNFPSPRRDRRFESVHQWSQWVAIVEGRLTRARLINETLARLPSTLETEAQRWETQSLIARLDAELRSEPGPVD